MYRLIFFYGQLLAVDFVHYCQLMLWLHCCSSGEFEAAALWPQLFHQWMRIWVQVCHKSTLEHCHCFNIVKCLRPLLVCCWVAVSVALSRVGVSADTSFIVTDVWSEASGFFWLFPDLMAERTIHKLPWAINTTILLYPKPKLVWT